MIRIQLWNPSNIQVIFIISFEYLEIKRENPNLGGLIIGFRGYTKISPQLIFKRKAKLTKQFQIINLFPSFHNKKPFQRHQN